MASESSEILLAGTREASIRAWSEQLERMGRPVTSAVGPDATEAAVSISPLLVVVVLNGEAALELADSCKRRELPLLLLFEPSGLRLLGRSRDLHPLGYSLPPHPEDQLHATLEAAIDAACEHRAWRLELSSCRVGLGMPKDKVRHWDTELSALFHTGEPRTLDFSFTDPGGNWTYLNRDWCRRWAPTARSARHFPCPDRNRPC